MAIRALLFDFDGLILDTEEPAFQTWQEIYREHGSDLPLSVWAACIGTSNDAFDPCAYLEAQLGRPLDREVIRQQYRRRSRELVETQPIRPGVGEYIAAARQLGIKLGVASSSSRERVAGHLSRLGILGFFDSLKGAEDVQKVKPAPELYLASLKALHLQADQAVAFEDSPNGILAAKQAGLYCVAVPNFITSQLVLDQADLQIASLSDYPLETLLAEVTKHTR